MNTLMQNILEIDRSTPFNPETFMGPGWQIEEEDKRSIGLPKIPLAKISFDTMFRRHETSILGEERLKRLKAWNLIRLDAKIFQTLFENQELIPEDWKIRGNIFFDGTILRDPNIGRCSLYFCWRGGRWLRCTYWLDYCRGTGDPSATLAGWASYA